MDLLAATAALILVLGLIGLLAFLARRMQGRNMGMLAGFLGGMSNNRHQNVELREIKILDNRSRLAVVRWRGQEYLLGLAEQQITVIDTFAPAALPPSPEAAPSDPDAPKETD